ncbi:MAG: AzlD domain-containing protein [Ornithinimicrobium sp.]
MSLWAAVLAACALSYGLKLSGYLVPERALADERVGRVTPLLPVALLSALILTQSLLDGGGQLTLDARAAGLGVAVLALMARAPFLLVLVLAALTAALVRMVTG